MLPCPVIAANEKLQQPNPRQDNKRHRAMGMKGRVTPLEQELRPAELLAEGEGNTDWRMEEGSYKYQLMPHEQFQNP